MFPLDGAADEASQQLPYFLPDGKQFLYQSSQVKQPGVWLGSLDVETRRFLFEQMESSASYAPNREGNGWLLYTVGGQLFTRPFDAAKGVFTGEAVAIAESFWSRVLAGQLP
ncbi:MAG TPA: hypothetical protein VKE70_25125 [Candidatus Solibacter sp.]|nr:hypothetical protein [Candidatus Solibacter sp.]